MSLSNLDRAEVKGTVRLNKGFTATGKVRLVGATIGSNLSCQGAELNPSRGGTALSMDRIKVKGSVFLDEGFSATGTVRLLGASIDGQFACAGARIETTAGEALSMDRAQVKGNIIFDRDAANQRDFYVSGDVSLIGTAAGAELRLQLPVITDSKQGPQAALECPSTTSNERLEQVGHDTPGPVAVRCST